MARDAREHRGVVRICPGALRAAIRDGEKRVLWTCEHEHHRQQDALNCADQEIVWRNGGHEPERGIGPMPSWRREGGRVKPLPGAP